jgi:hypothetical protein
MYIYVNTISIQELLSRKPMAVSILYQIQKLTVQEY